MAAKTVSISQPQTKPIKILKWKVHENNTVSIGRILFLYDFEGVTKSEQRKLKCTQAGTVRKIIAQEGAVVKPGEILFELEGCCHPTIMNDMCAECGADLQKEETSTTASVPMIHSIPDLKISEEAAQILGIADRERLITDRKLVLLVDLDQTLIHTTNDNIPANLKDVYHFQLYDHNLHSPWYHTRLRPGTHQFLNNIFDYFELHICTFGARNYAHTIARYLDGDGRFFANRILSRDECFDATSKKANLKALFPCGDDMVCIIDDREDVWSHATNLIHVKPYHFFQHTGDINAPPGLDKHENDNTPGVDLSKICKNPDRGNNDKVVQNGNVNKDEVKINVNNKDSNKIEVVNGNSNESKEGVELNTEKGDNEVIEVENVENDEKSNDKVGENKEDVEMVDKVAESKNNAENSEDNLQKIKDNKVEKTKNEEVEIIEKAEKCKTIVESKNKIEINQDEDVEMVEEVQKCKNKIQPEDTPKDKLEEDKDKVKEIKNNLAETTDSVPKSDDTPSENKQLIEEVKEDKTDPTEKKQESTLNQEKTNGVQPDKTSPVENQLLEVEDPDDYLIYLEDVLKRIHKAFYEELDKLQGGEIPDLKKVIPSVRNKILKGNKLVFSGLVPTNMNLEQSKAYLVARSLGATVSQDLARDSTHLVAVRPGTAKVNAGKRKKNLKIVTPDWLWCCAERWEHVDERIFPLNNKGSKNRHPPPHCSSPQHVPDYPQHDTPALRKRTPSGRFMDTINPLMTFSSADIADMGKEVEDILDDESDSSDEDAPNKAIAAQVLKDKENESSSSSSEESVTAEFPRGFKRKRDDEMDNSLLDDLNNSTEEDELPSTKFRRGECLDSEFDIDEDSEEGSVEPPDEIDDGDWNILGAALEREFLSNN